MSIMQFCCCYCSGARKVQKNVPGCVDAPRDVPEWAGQAEGEQSAMRGSKRRAEGKGEFDSGRRAGSRHQEIASNMIEAEMKKYEAEGERGFAAKSSERQSCERLK